MGNKMNNIILRGQDALQFFQTVFFPNQEEKNENKRLYDRIDETINITNNEQGFVAIVKRKEDANHPDNNSNI